MTAASLPYMFDSWKEYRNYLTDNLITKPEWREKFHARWRKMDETFSEMVTPDVVVKAQIKSILVCDIDFVKITNFLNSPPIIAYTQWRKGKLNSRTRDKKALIHIKPEYL